MSAKKKVARKKVLRTGPIRARSTSFATLKDLRGYINCLLKGGSPTYCYNKGDNGTGYAGANTAQLDKPLVAIPPAEMRKRWGTTKAAHLKFVRVKLDIGHKQPFLAQVGDIGPVGVVDLNPAALVAAGLRSDTELSASATWEWV